ncbi:hypothetical protein E4U43_005186 [Claviceps pusilla]|uniref:Uncharacterized protein n=1 Tax=Claviceps pusilla TaxID=123648 RepID=A0A9P7N561_9HYPO|nr:hypothetical protein E4U43_005186 [Claviceps pusilla]
MYKQTPSSMLHQSIALYPVLYPAFVPPVSIEGIKRETETPVCRPPGNIPVWYTKEHIPPC